MDVVDDGQQMTITADSGLVLVAPSAKADLGPDVREALASLLLSLGGRDVERQAEGLDRCGGCPRR